VVGPTQPSAAAAFSSKPPFLHGAKADLDPTEWKPSDPDAAAAKPPEGLPRRSSSEAFLYLSQFHRPGPSPEGCRRTGTKGRSAASAVLAAPDLSHSMATSAGSSDGSAVGTPDEGDVLTMPTPKPKIVLTPPAAAPGARAGAGPEPADRLPRDVSYAKKGVAPGALEEVGASLKKLLALNGTAEGL
jgi:hypothetical protein